MRRANGRQEILRIGQETKYGCIMRSEYARTIKNPSTIPDFK
jgi:hypothetical protein